MVTVSKEITRLEHSAVKLTLTVAKNEVCSEYDKIVGEYCKSIQIPGFRKGKAPKAVLERKLGASLHGEVLNHIIEEATRTVLEELPPEDRPLPYSTPKIQEEPVFNLEADLVFALFYDVLPTVTLGQWKGIEVEVPDVSISDEDINRELQIIQDRNATVSDKNDDAPAVKGDVATVDYSELTDDGTAVPDTERQDFVFTLGSGHNVFKFDDDILGMKKGEAKDIEKTYPGDFEDPELAGKTKKLRVRLTALKEKKLPDLDDDLAQDVDEKYQTLEDLKNSIRERLARDIEERLQSVKINKVIEKIMEQTPADLPESMIQFQLDTHWRKLSQRLNIPVEQLMEMVNNPQEDMSKLTDAWRPDTIKALHSRLILEAVIKDLALEVSDEEITAHLETLARNTGTPLEEIQAYYEREGMREYLEEEVKERKAYKQILAESRITLGDKKNYLEFTGNTGDNI